MSIQQMFLGVGAGGINPRDYFDVKLYTGNSGTNAQTGLGFEPDFLWLKRRNGLNAHALFDQIRGVTKALESSTISADKTNDPAIGSFDSNGFTLTGSTNQTNASSQSYVAWCWNAGGSTVSNTDGSITSSVRANPSAGFSIVSYTGVGNIVSTVGTGLNAVPSLIMVKDRDEVNDWAVYHSGIGATKDLCLNSNGAVDTRLMWNNTEPTSSVFTIGAGNNSDYRNRVNDTNDYIAYCWSEVAGYSKFGTYEGNNSTDGPEVDVGFQPTFVMIKNIDYSGTDWVIYDTARDTSNPSTAELYPDTASAEVSSGPINLLSTGFKQISQHTHLNKTYTYLYAAFA